MLWYFGSCLLLHLLISRIKEGCSVPVSETENVYDQGRIKLLFLNKMRAYKRAHPSLRYTESVIGLLN